MSSNFQGRRRGKSVSFRGSSNDSNFYDSRPRNDSNNYENRQRNTFREPTNFEGSNKQYPDDIDSRIVKLLPDANMTISVQNDFRGQNKSRGRGSRGILKSNSFRDDTFIYNRSSDINNRSSEFNNRSNDYNSRPSDFNNRSNDYNSRPSDFNNRSNDFNNRPSDFNNRSNDFNNRPSDFNNRSNDFNNRPSDFNNRSEYDDYNSHSKRGFEAPFRGRGRTRGFFNRSHGSKYQENEQETDKDKEFSQGNDTFRGRSKSAGERGRRSRGSGRGRGQRGKQFYRSSDDQNESFVSGDGDRTHIKEDSNNLETEPEPKLEENEETEYSVLPESNSAIENTENEDQVATTSIVSVNTILQEDSQEKLEFSVVDSESQLQEINGENKESEEKSENPDMTTDQA